MSLLNPPLSTIPIWTPKYLTRNSIIGSTVCLSDDDPNLKKGIALTTLQKWDRKYVKYADIDLTSDSSHRFWRDIYLLIPITDNTDYYNTDANQQPLKIPPIKVGDECFSLFLTKETNYKQEFTTVYYKAVIRQLPSILNERSEIVIDFNPPYIHLSYPLFTDIEGLRVPVIIRRICANNSFPALFAIKREEEIHGQRNDQKQVYHNPNQNIRQMQHSTNEKYEEKIECKTESDSDSCPIIIQSNMNQKQKVSNKNTAKRRKLTLKISKKQMLKKSEITEKRKNRKRNYRRMQSQSKSKSISIDEQMDMDYNSNVVQEPMLKKVKLMSKESVSQIVSGLNESGKDKELEIEMKSDSNTLVMNVSKKVNHKRMWGENYEVFIPEVNVKNMFDDEEKDVNYSLPHVIQNIRSAKFNGDFAIQPFVPEMDILKF